MRGNVDNERAALYSAELAAFDGTDLEAIIGQEFIAAGIQQVTTGEWWPGPAIEVRPARANSRSSSTCCDVEVGAGTAAIIRLVPEQATIATAAHELAHALAGVAAGHGPVFRRAYLDVVAVITNLDSTDRRHDLHVSQLREALTTRGLRVGDRKWVAPRAELLGPIAL